MALEPREPRIIEATPLPPGAVEPDALPVALPISADALLPPDDSTPAAEPIQAEPTPAPPEITPHQECPICQTPHEGDGAFCSNCGYLFTGVASQIVPGTNLASDDLPAEPLQGRYQLKDAISSRPPILRYRGVDRENGDAPVMILRRPKKQNQDGSLEGKPDEDTVEAILASQAKQANQQTDQTEQERRERLQWPTLVWEAHILNHVEHRSLPKVLGVEANESGDYVIEEVLAGRSLWDAWDDPATTWSQRLGWLIDIAAGVRKVHEAGAIFEILLPDRIVVTTGGHAGFADVRDMLPLPLPDNVAVQGSLYTAPEIILGEEVDFRADLYGFGALLFALELGHELTELDFERPGVPKPYVMRFPNAHPFLARILMKTFEREPPFRFPTADAAEEDPSGFSELLAALREAQAALSRVRLDVSGWTTTGVQRAGNEDAFACFLSSGSHLERIGERALAIVTDGMGGHDAGEVASALAIESLKARLRDQPPFSGCLSAQADGAPDVSLDSCLEVLAAALKVTNQHIYAESRKPDQPQRLMGCTSEVVYVDGENILVGHVGDSRTYHYHEGRLKQLTRDHTLVNRLVELGNLSPEEAEDHPRRNELQQAIGGQPEVSPETCHARLSPGDWVLICTDGLSGHVDDISMIEAIQSSDSAEACARRLVNFANFLGGPDNCTVVVIRAT